MRISIIFFSALWLIVSCSRSAKETNSGGKDTVSLETNLSDTTLNREITEENFPREWIRINDTDSGLIVYNPCNAENPNITIDLDFKKFTMNYGQDGEVFDIISHSLREESGKTYTMHFMDLELKSSSGEIIKTSVELRPQPEPSFWKNLPQIGDMQCIPRASEKAHRVYTQPCKECWEEC